VVAAPAAVVAAPAAVVLDDLSSDPHAATNRTSPASVAMTARGTAPRPRTFDELDIDSPQIFLRLRVSV
jgi:hypothetical protein